MVMKSALVQKLLVFVSLLFCVGCENQAHRALRDLAYNDIVFMTKTITENHPGPQNNADPDFMGVLNNAHQEAIQNAEKIKTIAQYGAVLRTYAKAFRDSHISLWFSTEVELVDLNDKAKPVVQNFALESFAPTVSWVTLPTFAPTHDEQIKLNEVIAQLPAQRTQNVIIFDVRGNTGGNSEWGAQIVKALFGTAYADKKIKELEQNVSVDWRVSQGNLEYINNMINDLRTQLGWTHETVVSWQRIYDGMAQALTSNLVFYNERNSVTEASISEEEPINECKAKIVVLIDHACGSACLDFIDMLMALDWPVTLVGQTTGADSLYMEARSIELPSKKGMLCFPIKVYRGRKRGNNQAYTPDIEFSGDIKNTQALKEWLTTSVIDGFLKKELQNL